MNRWSEIEIREEIAQIGDGNFTAMRQTRRYLDLSRRIRRAIADLEHQMECGDSDDARALRDQRRVLHLLDEDVRVRALRCLRSTRRLRLGFGYGPQVTPKSVWGK